MHCKEAGGDFKRQREDDVTSNFVPVSWLSGSVRRVAAIQAEAGQLLGRQMSVRRKLCKAVWVWLGLLWLLLDSPISFRCVLRWRLAAYSGPKKSL